MQFLKKNKKYFIIIVGVIAFILITGILLNKVQASDKIKDITKENDLNERFEKAIENNVNEKEIIECLKNGVDPNFKCEDGSTLYNKTINAIVKKAKDDVFITKYFELCDHMKEKGADKNLVKIEETKLNDTQKNFLGGIGIIASHDTSSVKHENSTLKENNTENKSKNFTMNGFELLEIKQIKDTDYIGGKIKNNNDFNCSYVEIKVNFYDESGNVLDSGLTNINNLKSGETWNFKIPVLIKQKGSFKTTEINGYK